MTGVIAAALDVLADMEPVVYETPLSEEVERRFREAIADYEAAQREAEGCLR